MKGTNRFLKNMVALLAAGDNVDDDVEVLPYGEHCTFILKMINN